MISKGKASINWRTKIEELCDKYEEMMGIMIV